MTGDAPHLALGKEDAPARRLRQGSVRARPHGNRRSVVDLDRVRPVEAVAGHAVDGGHPLCASLEEGAALRGAAGGDDARADGCLPGATRTRALRASRLSYPDRRHVARLPVRTGRCQPSRACETRESCDCGRNRSHLCRACALRRRAARLAIGGADRRWRPGEPSDEDLVLPRPSFQDAGSFRAAQLRRRRCHCLIAERAPCTHNVWRGDQPGDDHRNAQARARPRSRAGFGLSQTLVHEHARRNGWAREPAGQYLPRPGQLMRQHQTGPGSGQTRVHVRVIHDLSTSIALLQCASRAPV